MSPPPKIVKYYASIEEITYKTWLLSISGNPSMGDNTIEVKTFLSHAQRYPFIPPLQQITEITKQAYKPLNIYGYSWFMSDDYSHSFTNLAFALIGETHLSWVGNWP